ncbi:biotin--[acetyl-CoA-carboxylase] ligase [Clostridium chauvoei]|uniref:Bifunctional ligase/repressor BirA n=2 Tax=Clostridium chauvoei TaxID=46867 RepID=S6FL65_9CLOT|nr:biotin--[acetyl-CoA-carboxylase] ligase [Clostridium chauvoei]ATD54740.1 biotin--[acetyl-CoA-carboxylase] ligase [Clostridium chauvoei]ATD57579.1 biotin--[acetyl-CoA-carboxylase] ligase [Clostridium chauvoei]MBX7280040.1 biotin--[acetyl-CoA-carboxylase] ligase [Clostridium chauvoei]MBX7282301.1 biotin--[acetyl-CoA-carboxylase] ligase [Clostridium chauvoei]MBX7284931.1 biotin--[acetyl-CoA-carboxylase] ligase [Clostridium chauvoei]
MKEKVLTLLKGSNDFISGQKISDKLGITRSSVWKYINILKREGYVIEGISNKGYKLISSYDILNPLEIKEKLKTKNIGKNINYFESIDSTNIKAKNLANSNSPDGTLVISETQSLGKGRLDREWISPKGGIWASLILKPNLEPIHAPKITLIAAAAMAITLKGYSLDIKIKWPNDLILKDKKVCGILTEMNCDMDRINYIILGFGLNVNIPEKNIPINLKSKATSLLISTGKSFSRTDLLCNFLNNFEILYNELLDKNHANTSIDICRKYSLFIDEEIIISTLNENKKVKCIDITSDGSLLVLDSLGNKSKVFSGEVSLSKNYIID